MPLRNPFRRPVEAPSLSERAASLRASLRPSPTSPAVLPAPGSAEAKAAWLAACHAHSVRSAPLQDCPELMTPRGDVWTKGALGKALETGGVTVAEYARLYPLASERELRLDQIGHELNTAALFALAYADEYERRPVAKDTAESYPLGLIAAAGLSLKTMPLRDLIALHGVARLLGGVASAVTCQPRSMTGDHPNGVGLLVEWLVEALDGAVDAAAHEMQAREPADRIECQQRLVALAETTIHNDDPAMAVAFARELLTMVEK